MCEALERAKARSNVLIICVHSRAQSKLLVNPPGDHVFDPGDDVLLLSREDPANLAGDRRLDRVFDG